MLNGTNEQVENAAEIALEHHLGMTCDPASPCRASLAAETALMAPIALRSMQGTWTRSPFGTHVIPLDNCIEAIRQTGEEMNTKYMETSLGGIAVNLPAC
jgi:L-serine dehydratase